MTTRQKENKIIEKKSRFEQTIENLEKCSS
jgi:hypothetical protein